MPTNKSFLKTDWDGSVYGRLYGIYKVVYYTKDGIFPIEYKCPKTESSPNKTSRALHRLTTHSLRHTGISAFNRAVGGDIVLTKAYARHREISSTMIYVHTSKEELYDGIERAFSKNIKTLEMKA